MFEWLFGKKSEEVKMPPLGLDKARIIYNKAMVNSKDGLISDQVPFAILETAKALGCPVTLRDEGQNLVASCEIVIEDIRDVQQIEEERKDKLVADFERKISMLEENYRQLVKSNGLRIEELDAKVRHTTDVMDFFNLGPSDSE